LFNHIKNKIKLKQSIKSKKKINQSIKLLITVLLYHISIHSFYIISLSAITSFYFILLLKPRARRTEAEGRGQGGRAEVIFRKKEGGGGGLVRYYFD
jgi:hypothetical protein